MKKCEIFCCNKFKEAVEEGAIYFFEHSNQFELDGYDMIGDYPVNYCPNCGIKLDEFGWGSETSE